MPEARDGKAVCPSCGGPLSPASRRALTAVCSYCGSTLIVDSEGIRSLGKLALLADPPSLLAVGGEFLCRGRRGAVLGRLQFQYREGLWDEWWVRFADDGAESWISQDEGEYMVENQVPAPAGLPGYDSVRPGDRLGLAGAEFWVDEKDEAWTVAAQGCLPFRVEPDEYMRYLDLSDGRRFATLSYFWDGSVEAYLGESLAPEDIAVPREAGGSRLER